MLERVMYFIDGENLVCRYQKMLQEGCKPLNSIKHEKDIYVWHGDIIKNREQDIVRVTYYTYSSGSKERIRELNAELQKINYWYKRLYGTKVKDTTGYIFPRVFHKPKKSAQSKGVDINMTIDMLHYSALGNLDAVYLLSGDGDFIPLIKEVMRNGVRVYLMALSSGLNPDLPISVDRFENIDDRLFQPRGD